MVREVYISGLITNVCYIFSTYFFFFGIDDQSERSVFGEIAPGPVDEYYQFISYA